MIIDGWTTDDFALNFGSQPVDCLGFVDFLKEVIVWYNGSTYKGWVYPHSRSLVAHVVVRPTWIVNRVGCSCLPIVR